MTAEHPEGEEFQADDLLEAEEEAGFDLDVDVAQPLPHPGNEAFDLDLDIGLDHP
ncbi:MAG TPA: hypothetical protein VFG33_25125 [Kribbella sp.]|uniref:hypothetical protein n=1 Tax=Kribbella sp. TaxID=1871183 RepID=UPI002D77886E|nr:hypothetical protein [Kribbella sp.]HET6296694.1 hypothetical protein [Kribbella sp.]